MTVDLWGIDAPEIKQICKTGYLAGVVAAVALTELTREKTVTCEFRGIVGGDGHVLGLCRANGNDLSKAMVKIGMAWAHTGHSQEYVALEAQARRERIGVHARACEPPWQYRSRVLGYDARVAPEPSGRSGSQ
jgi:endonuclease YncB( thermonuclease family)